MNLTLRRITNHPQAVENYRVKYNGVEIGSIGVSRRSGNQYVWTWGIETAVSPPRGIDTHGEGADREDCMKQFKEAWQIFAADTDRLDTFFRVIKAAAGKS